ncbi:Peptidylprolyl isomerase [Elusimicrobium minutum Pei191]|uniref:Peptidyl-prolyl cis-trans isomerase n=1 Tax=Elusimicrobium minutum (strain Pei191) TaxID=445932 RepID=B2KCX6_ELUMP|nr:peptidylprolyl isomerase [Elusimicrobium minutum]ACC98372.1 Peptidylprolyl isomerase [Elusimicrobium minutum Pei191]
MIKQGSKVKFDYTLKVDGEVRDTSEGRAPLEYVHGAGHIIKGLEKELEGMKAGESKVVTVAAAEGYGEVNPEAKKTVPAEAITNAKEIKVGDVVGAQSGGHSFQAVVTKVSDKEIELDFNHPLAGKELLFDVKIVEVN